MKFNKMNSLKVILVVAGVLFLAKAGGWVLIARSLRYILPVAVAYWLYRKVRNSLSGTTNEKFSKNRPPDEVIDICPKCGKQKSGSHNC